MDWQEERIINYYYTSPDKLFAARVTPYSHGWYWLAWRYTPDMKFIEVWADGRDETAQTAMQRAAAWIATAPTALRDSWIPAHLMRRDAPPPVDSEADR